MDLLAREPHRVIVGALRSALGTLGHVPAGQLRLEVGLRVHCAFPPRFSRARAPKWRSPEVVASTFHRRVWPNPGAARPDSHADVNVLAVLHPRNTINDWLIKNVTPWPHEGLAFAKDRRRVPRVTAREIADDDGAVSIGKARTELGFDPRYCRRR